jgi:hypothetical protein
MHAMSNFSRAISRLAEQYLANARLKMLVLLTMGTGAVLQSPTASMTSRAAISSRSSSRPPLQYSRPHGGMKMGLHPIQGGWSTQGGGEAPPPPSLPVDATVSIPPTDPPRSPSVDATVSSTSVCLPSFGGRRNLCPRR